VAEHRNDLTGNMQCHLKEKCNKFVAVHLTATATASTDVRSNTQLVFFRGVNEKFESVQELLERASVQHEKVLEKYFRKW